MEKKLRGTKYLISRGINSRFWMNQHEVLIALKFQLVTKTALFLVLLPLFRRFSEWMLESTGRVAIAGGDVIPLLRTPQGFLLIVLLTVLGTVVLTLDFVAFINIFTGPEERTGRELLKKTVKSLHVELMPILILVLYMILAVLALFLARLVWGGYRLPSFMLRYFNNSIWFRIGLFALILFLVVLAGLFHFTFHFILLNQERPVKAMKLSAKMVIDHLGKFLRQVLIGVLVAAIVFAIPILAIKYVAPLSALLRGWNVHVSRVVLLFLVSLSVAWIYFALLMLFPHAIKWGTAFFCECTGQTEILKDSTVVYPKDRKGLRIAACMTLGICLTLSVLGTVFFDGLFRSQSDLQVVAHRGGGNLAVENSVEGVEWAIDYGAYWTETDVQRSKDGVLVINHDNTFKRMAGVNRYVWNMTYDEIEQLVITDKNDSALLENEEPSTKVPTLAEMMDTAGGRIGMFIELKGKTADKAMANEVIGMIRERDMVEDTAILSVNYELINYIESVAPDINTGYLYYLTLDTGAKIKADFFVMEIGNATLYKIRSIHAQGKKAYVWTVNSDVAIKRMVDLPIDGIITDNVIRVQEIAADRLTKGDLDAVVDTILEWLL